MVAAALIIAAAVLASSPAAVAIDPVPTLVISLTAPFSFGFAICVLVYRLSSSPPLIRLASVSLGSVFGLAPLLALFTTTEILPQAANDWLLVIGIGVVTPFIPQLVYAVCAPIVGAARTSILGAVELPTMFLVGLLLFGETDSIAQAIACTIIVVAIFFSASKVTKNVAANIAEK